MAGAEQRTEQATAHKLREERRRGNVFRHRDIVLAGVFLCQIALIKWTLNLSVEQLRTYSARLFSEALPADFSIAYVHNLVAATLAVTARIVGLPMVLVLVLSFAGFVAQGGWNFAWEGLQPRPDRLMPKNNFTRIFSSSGAFDLVKNVLVFLILAYLGWQTISRLWLELPRWSLMMPRESIGKALGISYDLAWNAGLAFAVLSTVHYYIQKQQFGRRMRMTKQEVREEMKQLEGNPQIKGRIRRLQLQFSRRRMAQAVPKASVVITNPTHYAVALAYDSETMAAPKVVAKGRNWMALRIREIAEEHRVPIVENRELAQLLYRKVEIDEIIPIELYRAVAEVLAYLMKAKEAFSSDRLRSATIP